MAAAPTPAAPQAAAITHNADRFALITDKVGPPASQ
jgi:hypothetical protein